MNGIKYFQHGGANEGFRSQYFGSLEGGNGVVSVYGLKGFADTKVRKQVNIADTALLQSYTGHYRLRPDFVLTVTREGKNLFVRPTNPCSGSMLRQSTNSF